MFPSIINLPSDCPREIYNYLGGSAGDSSAETPLGLGLQDYVCVYIGHHRSICDLGLLVVCVGIGLITTG